MTDPIEFQSIDELFRRTFDGLPETPAPNGWDQPSNQVWEQVKTRIKPPRSGWSTQTIVLVSAFAVILALGLFLLFRKPVAQPVATLKPAAPEMHATQPVAADTPAAPEVVKAPEVKTAPVVVKKPAVSHRKKSVQEAAPAAQEVSHKKAATVKLPAQPLPGSALKTPPNSKAKEYYKALRPLKLLPPRNSMETPAMPVFPESLKVKITDQQ
jgi:hypothetical protein